MKNPTVLFKSDSYLLLKCIIHPIHVSFADQACAIFVVPQRKAAESFIIVPHKNVCWTGQMVVLASILIDFIYRNQSIFGAHIYVLRIPTEINIFKHLLHWLNRIYNHKKRRYVGSEGFLIKWLLQESSTLWRGCVQWKSKAAYLRAITVAFVNWTNA